LCKKWWCSEYRAVPCFPHQWEVYINFLDHFVERRAVKVCCCTSCWLIVCVECADHTHETSEMFLIAHGNGCKYTSILHYPFQSDVKNVTKCIFHIFCPCL
jgi:hypothetical protein